MFFKGVGKNEGVWKKSVSGKMPVEGCGFLQTGGSVGGGEVGRMVAF